MRRSFFGQYLVGKGILSREKLIEALNIQSQHNKRIGELAIEKGWLRKEDVEKILVKQRGDARLFGEIAIEMSLFNEQQVNTLLDQQQSNHKNLQSVLIEQDILAANIVREELQNYATFKDGKDNKFNLEWIRTNIKDGEIISTLISHTIKLIGRLGDMEVSEGECRFDREYLEDLDILIVEEIFGDRTLRYLFNVTKNIVTAVANGLLGAQGIYLSDGLCLDAGCEFVNVVCGNAIGKLAQKEISLRISPPLVKKFKRRYNYRFSKREDTLVVPILVPEGAVEIAIVAKNLYRLKE